MASILLNRNNMVVSLTGEKQDTERIKDIGERMVDSLSVTSNSLQVPPGLEDIPNHEAFITAAEIVFAVQGGTLFESGKGYSGSFEVLKTYLTRDYLWNSVRQVGGAYGCFIQFSSITGNMAIISYRDPQVRKTYDFYNQLPAVVADLELSQQALEQIIIGTYGNFDPHQSAAAKGAVARNEYLCGIDTEQKQRRLQEIRTTTLADLRSFSNRLQIMTDSSHRAIIGNRAKIETDQDLFDVISEL